MRPLATSLAVLACLTALLPPHTAGAEQADKKRDAAAKAHKPKFTISKETTYVTGPLDKDGYIDYAAALNKRLSQGVTPANNANVLLWQALGPQPDGKKMPAEFFELMGTKPPPERGEYFVDLYRYIIEHAKVDGYEDRKKIYDQIDPTRHRPWTPQQYPRIASWLKVNEKPLALVLEATRRPVCFSPLVPSKSDKGSSGLLGAFIPPGMQKCREMVNALTARAMLHAGQGRREEAWQDLLACHRLARLLGSGPTLIEGLVGVAIDSITVEADLALLASTDLSKKQIEDCLHDLQKLPPIRKPAAQVDVGERFLFLDIVMMAARRGPEYLEPFSGLGWPNIPDATAKKFWNTIDWGPTMRTGNQWYDRLVAAMRVKDRASRETELDKLETDFKMLKKKLADSPLNEADLTKEPAKTLSKALGDILLTMFFPAVRRVQQSADRAEQMQNNLYLAFALAAYQRAHGRYPAKLEALVPKYLAEIPVDLFSGKPLTYRPSKDGYLLYSVGVNGRDDEGRGPLDDPRGDDLSVRM
ncbi:MAG TPA: hypothetical protein VKI65_12430, partial [Gemmataceae bacterium]|nr:hypothetical protein [Gemmataceae bacterium]